MLLIKSKMIEWEVDSAGIGDWHQGQLPDRRAIATASRHGIDISNQRARQIKESDLDYFDLILTMDSENLKDAIRLTKNDHQKAKIRLLLDCKYPGKHLIVPDPYYTDLFEESYELIKGGCEAFITQLKDLDKTFLI